MKTAQKDRHTTVETEAYRLEHDAAKPHHVSLQFSNGIGAELFVASACDRDDGIDELVELAAPELSKGDGRATLVFRGKTTLWDKVEYVFTCLPDKVVYHYRVQGKGKLETVRFFEGFLANDPRMNEAFYPYFCGPGRHLAHKRAVKEFMQSSVPHFNCVYSYGINSTDKRTFGYYEEVEIRVNGDRHYLGGDWLATPSPFLYLMGNRGEDKWVSLGLAAKVGENRFMGYRYSGGEGFGLSLEGYMGYTEVAGSWESPAIVMQPSREVYAALESYVSYLAESGCMKKVDRSRMPRWWKQPIFGGWGEQVFHSNRWDNYYDGEHDDWSKDNVDRFCNQKAYEDMLATLESKGVNPTILIIDNRWFKNDAHLDVDTGLWPDLKGFIASQHKKGRKVILWVSPYGVSVCAKGKDVPIHQHMFVDEDGLYDLDIDTDVFYPACKREHQKVRRYYPLPEPTLTDANWRFTADPQNAEYVKWLKAKMHYLLSPEGLNADGFEFDYTHFLPKYRGTRPITPRQEKTLWGIEHLHKMIELYYYGAKEAKQDAVIISHTFNPYFNDVIDMLRLQDIYTDRRSIVPQMEHRARIAQKVAPGCAIHTDQHPMPSLEAWREYAKFQPTIGNPCTYYVTGIETTRERFTEEDYKMLAKIWNDYNAELAKDKNLT